MSIDSNTNPANPTDAVAGDITDFITVFQSRGPRMAKLVQPGKDPEGPEDAKTFDAIEIPISGPSDIREAIRKLIQYPTRFVVRGKLIGPTRGILRRSNFNPKTGEHPTLKAAAHRWLAIDLDGIPQPEGTDVTDLEACGRIGMSFLPEEFHGAWCIVQATASHGLKPGARLRLWFILSREVSDQELKSWLADYPVDQSIFTTATPIFTSAPVFAGGAKEHLPCRQAELPGGTVSVPAEIYLPASNTSASATPTADIEDVQSALAAMDNTGSWDDWNKIGMATWHATGGSAEGLEAWTAWSEKNSKHDPYNCESRWDHYFESPPINVGFGTLHFQAKQSDPTWQQPSKPRIAAEDEFEAEPEPDDVRLKREKAEGKAERKAKKEAERKARENTWQSRLHRHVSGKAKPHLANAMTAFEHAPEWAGVISYDVFANKIIMTVAPPYQAEAGRPLPMELRDDDINNAARWLQDNDVDASSAIAGSALVTVARQRSFHPVRGYLSSIKWDGEPRIDRWLIDHLGAADTELNRAFGAKWLLSGVARVMEPGCKVDTVLFLEGDQGLGKSTALSVMAGKWFCDHMPDLSSKDAMQQMQGVWIMEHAEFDTFGKAEATRLKAFVSTATDRFRVPYGRAAEDFPRQCIFAVSHNPNGVGVLKDETGARRFWMVACGVGWGKGRQINTDALALVRDQLWAEARDRYAAGEKWWLPNNLETAAAKEAAKRYDTDAWTSAITEYLEGKSFVTISDILCSRLGIMTSDHDRLKQNRVGRVLRVLGWREGTGRVNNKPTTGFRAPDRDAATDGAGDNVVSLFPVTAAQARAQEEFESEIHPDDLAKLLR
jgi:predicted P-loop ATPase